MKAIILNAGLGTRLLPITSLKPKCLIEIQGKNILEHQINTLRNCGIEKIIVVVGYLKEKVMEFKRSNLIFIENPIYDKTNSSYSLWLAQNLLRHEQFVYLNGDLFFHPDILKSLLASIFENAIVVEKTINGKDDSFKALMDGDHIIKMEKQKTGTQPCIEVPGPAKLSEVGSDKLFQAIDDHVKKGNYNSWVYTMFNEIAHAIDFRGVFISGLPWIEIDDPDDLEKASTFFQ